MGRWEGIVGTFQRRGSAALSGGHLRRWWCRRRRRDGRCRIARRGGGGVVSSPRGHGRMRRQHLPRGPGGPAPTGPARTPCPSHTRRGMCVGLWSFQAAPLVHAAVRPEQTAFVPGSVFVIFLCFFFSAAPRAVLIQPIGVHVTCVRVTCLRVTGVYPSVRCLARVRLTARVWRGSYVSTVCCNTCACLLRTPVCVCVHSVARARLSRSVCASVHGCVCTPNTVCKCHGASW